MRTYWPRPGGALADAPGLLSLGLQALTGDQQGALRQLVQKITVETAWLPPIEVDDPFGPPSVASAEAKGFVKFLKPKLTITLGGGLAPQVVAPYGDPGPTQWPLVSAAAGTLGVVAAGLLGLGLLGALVPKRRR